jgi:hypothetical protein
MEVVRVIKWTMDKDSSKAARVVIIITFMVAIVVDRKYFPHSDSNG